MFCKKLFSALNIKKKCDEYNIGIWGCPQFLFIVMGAVIIVSIIGTDIVSRRYVDPEVVSLIVLAVTTFLFLIGHAAITSFEKIAEMSKAKSDFISIVSHELRSPLTNIKWQIEAIEDKKIIPTEANWLETVGIIKDQNKKVFNIVNDMLIALKMEDKIADLNPEAFSVIDLTDKILKDHNRKIEEIKAIVNVSSSEEELFVFADKQKIKMVIEHLVDNALKYGKLGQKLDVSINKKSDRLLFWSITDQGEGIPKKDESQIFGKFFRGRQNFKYKTDGIGLGLYIARITIEKSKGRMGFKSKEGEGSTFWFTLPLADNLLDN